MSAGGRLCTLQENPHFWVPRIKVTPPDGITEPLVPKYPSCSQYATPSTALILTKRNLTNSPKSGLGRARNIKTFGFKKVNPLTKGSDYGHTKPYWLRCDMAGALWAPSEYSWFRNFAAIMPRYYKSKLKKDASPWVQSYEHRGYRWVSSCFRACSFVFG